MPRAKLAERQSAKYTEKYADYIDLKMARLNEWCRDVNQLQSGTHYDFVYVDQPGFERYRPKSFRDLVESYTSYKNGSPETGG